MKRLIKLMCAVAFGSTFGAELYVDRSGADGAYTSINAAIAAADPYDTILVRPGVYDNNPAANTESSYSDVPAVVYVTKPLTIRATSDNPADTHIVGSPDPDVVAGGDAYGGGPNAVRCVRFSLAASQGTSPSVLKGFTIRDGRCYTKETEPDDDCGEPGGVAGSMAGSANFYVVDCVISNCVGVRGGLVRKGTYVRCRFSDGYGYAGQSVGRSISMLSCLVVHCGGNTIVMDGGAIVNTTFADMGGVPYYTQSSVPLYNCVIASCKEDRAATAKGSATDSLIPYPEAVATKVRCVDQISDSLPYPLIAPLAGDFRLRSGTAACGIGRAEHIATCFPDAPAIVDVYKDFGGRRIPQVGAINPGCYQETVEAKTGVMQFGTESSPNYVTCNGYSGMRKWLYAFGREAYETFVVSTQPGEALAFYCKIGGFVRYPEMDETFRVMAPPIGTFATNDMVIVTNEFWVDPTNGADAAEGGTQAAPFKTLQYACDNAPVNGRTLIHAAAGVYDEGGVLYGVSDGHTNRVAIVDRRHTRIKGAGRGRSFIVGKADTTSPGAYQGMGPAAIRCVIMDDTYGCVQGFTLKDGYSDYTSDTSQDDRRYSGGLFWGWKIELGQRALVDCELIGGKAFRGSQANGGSLVRCIVREADSLEGGAMRLCSVENCVLADTLYQTSWAPLASEVRFIGCTLVSRDASPVNHNNSGLKLTNCIVRAARAGGSAVSSTASLSKVHNTVFWGYESISGSDTMVLADPKFVDDAVYDYRLRTDSPAILTGFKAPQDQWRFVQTDVNGRPIVIRNGMVIPGAVQDFAEVVTVKEPLAGSFDVTGDTVLEVGESVTVSHTAGQTRQLLGVSVNGETLPGNTFTYTSASPYAEDGSIKAPIVVSADYSTNWYVNATTGNDANNGFTPATPWRTLAKLQAMTNIFWTGDVVHAAAGDYNEGTVLTVVRQSFKSGYDQLPSRVEIPGGVTLVADEGPEVTFITGASGSGSYGMGSGAVRCASICDGGRLEGFTLRGGRTFNTVNDGDQFCGGGVFARSVKDTANCGVVFGCVITNCVGQRGGAVRNGRAINCRILSCGATACAAAGSLSWFLGCYIHDCLYNSQLMRDSYFVGNCTFSATQHSNGSAAVNEVSTAYGGVVNCVFLNRLGQFHKSAPVANQYKGCKFLETGITDANQLASLGEGCEQFSSAAAFGLDEQGRPLSKTAGTVDSSSNALATLTTNRFCGVDIGGVQRIYNGRMDAGCYEYDWRGEYRADLGVAVPKADAGVVEETAGQSVRLGSGGMEMLFTGGDRTISTAYSVPVEVQGAGTLTATLNGEPLTNLTSAAGAAIIAFRNNEIENRLELSYDGDDAGVLFTRTSLKRHSAYIILR